MTSKLMLVIVLIVARVSVAQADWTPPPMVPAPEPGQGVPPPPSPTVPPANPPQRYIPNAPATGYPYSPYGQPAPTEKPAPEVGLMVSESLFGVLTASGVSILPYFLLSASGLLTDSTIGSILLVVVFSAVPLAVSQTQISIANGSRFYYSETWPAALAGLGAEAAVLGLFYATGWLPSSTGGGGGGAGGGIPKATGSVPLLLIGTALVVPLIQMAVINLTKQPKFKTPPAAVTLGIPTASPVLSQTSQGTALGLSLNVLNGTW